MAVRIPLADGMEALVSDVDAHLAGKPWRWSQGYVICKTKSWNEEQGAFVWTVYRLQRLVLSDYAKRHIYFKDGNPLNCQRENLTHEYINRPGQRTGRIVGDKSNDGGWSTRRAKKKKRRT